MAHLVYSQLFLGISKYLFAIVITGQHYILTYSWWQLLSISNWITQLVIYPIETMQAFCREDWTELLHPSMSCVNCKMCSRATIKDVDEGFFRMGTTFWLWGNIKQRSMLICPWPLWLCRGPGIFKDALVRSPLMACRDVLVFTRSF